MKTLICGGRIIDPAQNMDEIGDILIEDGKIAQIAPKIIEEADQTINAEGHVVMPGLLICTYICANRDLNIKRRYGPAPWRLQGAV